MECFVTHSYLVKQQTGYLGSTLNYLASYCPSTVSYYLPDYLKPYPQILSVTGITAKFSVEEGRDKEEKREQRKLKSCYLHLAARNLYLSLEASTVNFFLEQFSELLSGSQYQTVNEIKIEPELQAKLTQNLGPSKPQKVTFYADQPVVIYDFLYYNASYSCLVLDAPMMRERTYIKLDTGFISALYDYAKFLALPVPALHQIPVTKTIKEQKES